MALAADATNLLGLPWKIWGVTAQGSFVDYTYILRVPSRQGEQTHSQPPKRALEQPVRGSNMHQPQEKVSTQRRAKSCRKTRTYCWHRLNSCPPCAQAVRLILDPVLSPAALLFLQGPLFKAQSLDSLPRVRNSLFLL